MLQLHWGVGRQSDKHQRECGTTAATGAFFFIQASAPQGADVASESGKEGCEDQGWRSVPSNPRTRTPPRFGPKMVKGILCSFAIHLQQILQAQNQTLLKNQTIFILFNSMFKNSTTFGLCQVGYCLFLSVEWPSLLRVVVLPLGRLAVPSSFQLFLL